MYFETLIEPLDFLYVHALLVALVVTDFVDLSALMVLL
jgi:hypothetical protein